MRAVDCTTTVEPDEVVLEFDHAYVVDGRCYAFNFQLSFRIEGLVRSELVAVSDQSFASFVGQLALLNESLSGQALMDSKDCPIHTPDFGFSIESHGHRGYLAVLVSLGLSEFSSFIGGFIAEPARLANWTSEFQRVLERKNPSVDFYRNWRTSLPLPERLRKLANVKRKKD